jgi:primosomal protein N' (replication factor Y) (superfamily II helicase)
MKYAEVSVNSPAARRRTYSYSVPDRLDIRRGQAVLVPFGEKELQGVVLELSAQPSVEDTREIIDVIEPEPVLSPIQLSLACWVSDYYLAPLFEAVSLMLPPGFERPAVTFLSAAQPGVDISNFSEDRRTAFEMVAAQGRLRMRELEKRLGKKKAQAVVSPMVRQGIFTRSYELAPLRVKPKTEVYIKLGEDAQNIPLLTGKQAALIDYLKVKNTPVAWSEVRREAGATRDSAERLIKKSLVFFIDVEVRRDPISYEHIIPTQPLVLSPDQTAALASITNVLGNAQAKLEPPIFLLHGVTASGKTEIYLQALAAAVAKGKKGIVLVPEIALTPQTIERFAARFPHRVAVLHSRLTLGEQYDEWRRIRDGEFDVVIGSRSAIFAPQPDLGLIILDEEHEWTYKQDVSPHYHAREAAIRLAGLTGAVVVLGSATPDIETYFKAQNGTYKLLGLPERIVPVAGAAMPRVEVVDMRAELKAGSRGIFSRSMTEAVNTAVANGEQVILFLNRRGGATFIQCRSCGYVLRCRRCDVPLAQHPAENLLTCHQCNYHTPIPKVCPNCSRPQLKFLGAGTQRLEEEVRYTFPRARQLRWDSDVTTGKNSHENILKQFREGKAEILVGTQMIAKGLDIPAVTLVGVINADTSLNLPDFRAAERTFQLLSQVAGRAGRGEGGGKVIIQTFSPDNYAIQAAARYDYISFYRQELAYRRQFHHPPFSRLARLVFTHPNDIACQREAERLRKILEAEITSRGIGDMEILGPAPTFISRLRGRYRWQLVLKGRDPAGFLNDVEIPTGWTVDIDPMSLVQ